MKITYTNLEVGVPAGPTLAECLIAIEGDLQVLDGDRQILAEPAFPLGELAHHLSQWRNSTTRETFVLDTMSTDPGWLLIEEREEGWSVGSILEPDVWSAPVDWVTLDGILRKLVNQLRSDLSSRGVNPDCIPEPVDPAT